MHAKESFKRLLLLVSALFLAVGAAARADVAPSIIKQPAGKFARRLGAVTLEVKADGTPPLTYQWFRDGTSFDGWNRRTLRLQSLTENDVGTYTVVVSNAAGSVTSEGARLLFGDPAAKPPNPEPAPAKPKATGDTQTAAVSFVPVTETYKLGERLKLEASAAGPPPFTFQWRKDGRPISGATSSVFEIAKAAPRDAGIYLCVVTNAGGGTASEPIRVVVESR